MNKVIIFSLVFLQLGASFSQVYAQTDTSIESDPIIETEINTTVSYDTSCVSNAIITQANSQMAIIETKHNTMKEAAIGRRDALASAYLLTDKTARNAAVKSANEAYKTAQDNSEQSAKTALESSGKTFKETLTSCGVKLNVLDGKKRPQNIGGKQGPRDADTQTEVVDSNNTDNPIKETGIRSIFQRVKNYFKF